jgi:hypothetical protein
MVWFPYEWNYKEVLMKSTNFKFGVNSLAVKFPGAVIDDSEEHEHMMISLW